MASTMVAANSVVVEGPNRSSWDTTVIHLMQNAGGAMDNVDIHGPELWR